VPIDLRSFLSGYGTPPTDPVAGSRAMAEGFRGLRDALSGRAQMEFQKKQAEEAKLASIVAQGRAMEAQKLKAEQDAREEERVRYDSMGKAITAVGATNADDVDLAAFDAALRSGRHTSALEYEEPDAMASVDAVIGDTPIPTAKPRLVIKDEKGNPIYRLDLAGLSQSRQDALTKMNADRQKVLSPELRMPDWAAEQALMVSQTPEAAHEMLMDETRLRQAAMPKPSKKGDGGGLGRQERQPYIDIQESSDTRIKATRKTPELREALEGAEAMIADLESGDGRRARYAAQQFRHKLIGASATSGEMNSLSGAWGSLADKLAGLSPDAAMDENTRRSFLTMARRVAAESDRLIESAARDGSQWVTSQRLTLPNAALREQAAQSVYELIRGTRPPAPAKDREKPAAKTIKLTPEQIEAFEDAP
jgi:hypothetical protein